MEPIKVFYCYSPQDKKLRDKLETHLMTLKRLRQITLRLNREILAGTDWSHIQDERFQMADLILLLVSPDFIASDYHYGIEMHHALEKHEAGNVWVIPIILRPTLWSNTPLGRLRVLPNKGKAVTEWANRDAAFVDVVKGISEVVAALLVQKQARNFSENANNSKITHIIGHTCSSCGARNLLETTSCENCGDLLLIDITTASQEENYSLNQSEMKTATSFFPNEILLCRYCGKVNRRYVQFCANCGGYIKASAQSVTRSEKNIDRANNTSQQLLPGGSLQGGRYIVEKILGQGGMGVTVLARDTRIANKPVAIKELISPSADPQQQQEDVRNFEREVETLATLDHPLIPNVTASFQEGSHYFMVQEYVVGENLEERIERLMQPLPEQDALTYASQILDVLDYLEQQRPPIVHRDIKPANTIISSRNKRAYLVDFGIARADRSITHADKYISKQTSALGTPGYAPPEQYEGNADPRSDLYALAAMLHHLLTNRDPRNYPLFVYPSARSLNPKLSSEIERVLHRGLMVDITKRYQNAAAMKHDIDDILTQRFGVDNTSNYTLGISGPIGTTATQTAMSRSSHSPNMPAPPSAPQPLLRTLSTPDLADTSQSQTKTSFSEVLVCPNCGTNYPPDDQFCSNCGTYLDASMTDTPIAKEVNLGEASSAGSITFTESGGESDSHTLTPGGRLENGRYVFKKVLGQGGMGVAVLAKDTLVSNKQVVIKELISDNVDPAKLQEDVRNFEREVEMLAHLDHPLIPTVTDSFQEGTRYFMVQEYVPGENLEDWLSRVNKPMPERVALGYASQVLDILDYLEQQTPPRIHRDIKPANIIVSSRNKHAYLVDFGIARALVNKNTKRRQVSALGTPGYAPPEQYQGNADQRSDLYALAATLHHLLTNRDPRDFPPFDYPSASTLNPKLSSETERVLHRGLMVDITKRYQNAAAMKHDIDDILTQRFGVDNTSIYTFGTSGSIGTTRIQTDVSQSSRFPNTPISPRQSGADGAPPVETQQQHIMNLLKRIMNPFNKG